MACVEPAPPIQTLSVIDDADPDLPPVAGLAGLVVMGGPMNVDDPRHPGLAAERRLVRSAVEAQVPVLGVCLGMQLLARALGSTVHAGHGTEVGFGPVQVVTADPLLGPLGPEPTVLHWHSDVAELPAGATLLARSDRTPVQAFRAGSAVGLQFHVEVDRALLDSWLASPAARDLSPESIAAIRRDATTTLPSLVPQALAGLHNFASDVRDRL